MAGFKEKRVSVGITIQPTPGTYNEPNSTTDLIAVSSPDDGFDDITGDDPTLTGSIFTAPRLFLGRKGRAGATAVLRGPGGNAPPAAGAFPLGRILLAAGFTELINAADITAVAQAGGTTDKIIMAGGSSAVDDFYKGMAIQHATIGADNTIKGTSLIRAYNGTTKTAQLMETVGAAIVAGAYHIPPQLTYLLGTGAGIPLLSAKVWRDKKARRYRDCALSSFAINIPVANAQTTEAPSIEFSMVGVPVATIDEAAPALPTATLTAPVFARNGKFTFNGIKLGHQTLRLEFSLETGALPNQNFVEGQESYEILSGSRNVTMDLNEQLVATLDIDALVEAQTYVPLQSGWGTAQGQSFMVGVPNGPLNSFNPNARNGFVGLQGGMAPSDVDRSIALSILWPHA